MTPFCAKTRGPDSTVIDRASGRTPRSRSTRDFRDVAITLFDPVRGAQRLGLFQQFRFRGFAGPVAFERELSSHWRPIRGTPSVATATFKDDISYPNGWGYGASGRKQVMNVGPFLATTHWDTSSVDDQFVTAGFLACELPPLPVLPRHAPQ